MLDEYMPSLIKETVTIEKKVFDALRRNNLDLMEKLEKTVEALNKILKRTKTVKNKNGLSEYARRICQNVLKDIEE